MSDRCLVTGAAGLIGFAVVRELLAEGFEVVAVDHGGKRGLGELTALAAEHLRRLTVLNVDLAADGVVLPLDQQRPVAWVLHFAAIVGVQAVTDAPWATLDVNLRSTLNTLRWARSLTARAFFFASSSECYAGGVELGFSPVPTAENVALVINDIQAPRWSYAASKIAGEAATFAMAKAAGFRPVVGRFHNVYGPRMGLTHVIPELIDRCRTGQTPLQVFGCEQTRSFMYVDDAARAVLVAMRAADRADDGIVHVGNAEETVIGDLARMICDITGHRVGLAPQPAPVGSVRRRLPDVRRLHSWGFGSRVGLREGIERCWQGQPGAPLGSKP